MIDAGTRLGRYEIRSLLGAGGMGEVYLAQDTTLRRLVALKILPSDFTANRDRLRRFEREAYAASSLNHPNILTIYEIGVEGGLNFIATEFIDGESLRQRIERGPMGLREVLDIGIQVASALAAAHEAAIAHRDIKPENIMIRRDGIVKVLDFGLAKLVEQEEPELDREAPTKALTKTDADAVMGTFSYMSPEQARGAGQVDERTDIWSLGVVLYEMVAGRLPFEGRTRNDVIAAVLKTEPPILTRYAPDAPAEIERIVTRALHKEKEERYQVVKDLGLDLKSLKRRLEFEAELDRTTSPEQQRNRQAARAASRSSGSATTVTGLETGGASDTHGDATGARVIDKIKQRKLSAALVLASLVVAATVAYFFLFARRSQTTINSIAVLPFINATGDPNAEYLSDGISESLINSLSPLPQLKVIARSSTLKYKGKEVDLQEVANQLGVQAIVTGRVVQRDDQLQISAELVDTRDKTQMWGGQYNRHAADLQAVQEEIARTISEKLRLRLTGAQEQQLKKHATPNPDAYQLYLNGQFHSRKNSLEDYRKALNYYDQAIALDPNFALAYIGLARVYNNLAGYSALDPKEALAKAKASAQKALELDEKLASAHNTMATIKLNEWDWAGAENEYKRALELNPNLANGHGTYAYYLSCLGRHDEALAENKRAQELDPLLLAFKSGEGGILQLARRYDEAIRQLQKVINMEPNDPVAHNYLGYAYASKGMYAEAISAYQKYISIEGEMTSIQAVLGYAYAMSGKRKEALALLKKLKTTKEYVSPAELAILYVGLGDKEEALQSLERAYAAHDLQLQYLKVEPHYDSLRSDPRFTDLMRRVGLAQ